MKRTNLFTKVNSQLSTCPLIPVNKVLKPCFLLSVLITFLLILSYGVEAAASTTKVTNIGAIIDGNSRTGKEEKTAMEIAVQNFNNISSNHKLSTSSILKETLFKQLMQVNNLAISKWFWVSSLVVARFEAVYWLVNFSCSWRADQREESESDYWHGQMGGSSPGC